MKTEKKRKHFFIHSSSVYGEKMLIKEKNTLVTRHTHRTHSVYINCLPFAKRNFMCHQFVKIIKNLKFYGYHKKVQNENYERILCVQIVRHLLFPVGLL